MVHLSQHLGFAFETGEALRICRQSRWQHLHRDFALELRIDGAVHLTHSPAPDDGLDLVMPELVTGRQGHRIAPFYPSATGSRFSAWQAKQARGRILGSLGGHSERITRKPEVIY